jgi:multisubunit Na+/H+ antiporter MnhB subunit
MAMATLELTLAVGVVIGIAFGIGISPIGALIAGMCVPLGTYMLVYLTSRRRRRR